MSHRVTTQVNITDSALAIATLRELGLPFTQTGDVIEITGGSGYKHARINLKKGTITGDSDHGHNSKKFGLLRQAYSRTKYRATLAAEGAIIESEEVMRDGVVEFIYTKA